MKTANLEVVWNDDYLVDDDFATEGMSTFQIFFSCLILFTNNDSRVVINGASKLKKTKVLCLFVVTAYKCDVMGPDCSICVSVSTTRPKFGCTWCGTSCKFTDICGSPSSNCPKPALTNVSLFKICQVLYLSQL